MIVAIQLFPPCMFVAIGPVCVGPVFQVMLYNGLPPPTVTVAEPFELPHVAGREV